MPAKPQVYNTVWTVLRTRAKDEKMESLLKRGPDECEQVTHLLRRLHFMHSEVRVKVSTKARPKAFEAKALAKSDLDTDLGS